VSCLSVSIKWIVAHTRSGRDVTGRCDDEFKNSSAQCSVNVNQHEQPRELDQSRKDHHTRRLNPELSNHNGRLGLEECFGVNSHFTRPTARTDEVKSERCYRPPEHHRQSFGEYDAADVKANVNNEARKELQKSGVNQILRSARRLVRRVTNQQRRRAVASDDTFGQIIGAVKRHRNQRGRARIAHRFLQQSRRVSVRHAIVVFDGVLKDTRGENDTSGGSIDAFVNQSDFGGSGLSRYLRIVVRSLECRVVVVGLVGVARAL